MVTAEELAARAEVLDAPTPDLQGLRAHLRARARPLLDRMPVVPEQKALLTTDGGFCPDDGAALLFDPWSPAEHCCTQCGKTWRGERHDWSWTRQQHLWLAERAAHLAALGALGERSDRDKAAARSRDILNAYAERYWRYPNRDNVLGPSRLFFSTYLESVWACNYLAAAMLLRGSGQLDEVTARGVHQVAEEAATIIGDYDEGFSNRQTWNNAALAAVAVWFEDEELAQRVIEGDTGLIAHLVRGYGRDGMWYEGENYHLFALRGLLTGLGWARLAGVDFAADERLAARVGLALQAPALTALPDFTFPARKDSRFGMSLTQPAYVEVWEIGLARCGMRDAGNVGSALASWLHALYQAPASPREPMESYLHDAPIDRIPHPVSRSSLSWWSLVEMLPELPHVAEPWISKSVLLENQGVAILRRADRYVSLECGSYGGGHGHPDRLQLILHADGVYWLPDPGTGQYVTRDLFWYRSTLAHNAPRLDGESQPVATARCESFEDDGEWAWVRGRFENLTRTVASGPSYVIDVVDLSAREDHVLELPWHFAGRGTIETKGRWDADHLADEFVGRVQRFVPDQPTPIVAVHVAERAQLTTHLVFEGELLEAEAPGLPMGVRHDRVPFYLVRVRGRNARIVSVLQPAQGSGARIKTVKVRGDMVEIETDTGVDRHRLAGNEWMVEVEGQAPRVLRGTREVLPPFVPLLQIDPPTPVAAPAFHVGAPPPLDGSLEGFELSEPLELALEDQYRRSEDAYPGPADLSAVGYAAWDNAALYLAVEVTKPELALRPAGSAPLKLDNEPDDIHSDGLQVYVAPPAPPAAAGSSGDNGTAPPVGYLIVPNADGHTVRASATSDTRGAATGTVTGGWQRTDSGYRVTVAIPWPDGVYAHAGSRVRFDLIVNEMLPGRLRRVGQLVWSGGGGWVWLRGDRQDPARLGILELVG